MVRFDTPSQPIAAIPADCLAIGLFDEDTLAGSAKVIDTATRGLLRKLKASGDLPVRPGETQLLVEPVGIKAKRLLVVGLGKRKDLAQRGWRKAVACGAGRHAEDSRCASGAGH